MMCEICCRDDVFDPERKTYEVEALFNLMICDFCLLRSHNYNVLFPIPFKELEVD